VEQCLSERAKRKRESKRERERERYGGAGRREDRGGYGKKERERKRETKGRREREEKGERGRKECMGTRRKSGPTAICPSRIPPTPRRALLALAAP